MTRPVAIHRLGRVAYGDALALQTRLLDARLQDRIGDTLLLLEHDPVITLGRGSKEEHILSSREALRARGIEVHDIGRGGDVTYHGPGQLVGYPILDLKPDRQDVRKYVGNLEELMIRVAGHHGLDAGRIAGLNGAWIGDRKLGAVGVRLRRWVTMHGFALNVSTDLDAYEVIVPCGISDKTVTSLSRELDADLTVDDVIPVTAEKFCDVFECEPQWHDGPPQV